MKAIVTGATGQCGGYLCEMLLEKGYEVFGMIRRNTQFNAEKSFIKDILNHERFHLVNGDVTDQTSINNLVVKIKPDEFYNLAAQSHVHESWDYPVLTAQTNAVGTLICLEAIRQHAPQCRFLQFSTSELFGKVEESPQNERTRFYPRSPYGIAKLFAFWAVVNYRESFGTFASNAILFNMESLRRGKNFVTQKIATNIARIKKELDEGKEPRPVLMGNLDARRNWNDVRNSLEYVWKMLQHNKPDDFVIGSGEDNSVREFIREALNAAGIEYNEEGDKFFSKDGKVLVGTDPEFMRPAEVHILKADPSKAVRELGYEIKYGFKDIVKEMVESAMKENSSS